ncbi:MAG: hypothetical protein ACU843_14325 [Gammaproteobacteria bacterium]
MTHNSVIEYVGKNVFCILAVCFFALGGCAGMQQPVKEAKVDFSQFAGVWEGKYESPATKRSGQVFLELTSGEGKATGGIIMHPQESGSSGTNKLTYADIKKRKAVPLTIEFVQAQGGKIQGTVTPYPDPMFNNAMMHPTFEGKLEGNTMVGTFTVMIGDTGKSYSGTWWGTKQ